MIIFVTFSLHVSHTSLISTVHLSGRTDYEIYFLCALTETTEIHIRRCLLWEMFFIKGHPYINWRPIEVIHTFFGSKNYSQNFLIHSHSSYSILSLVFSLFLLILFVCLFTHFHSSAVVFTTTDNRFLRQEIYEKISLISTYIQKKCDSILKSERRLHISCCCVI